MTPRHATSPAREAKAARIDAAALVEAASEILRERTHDPGATGLTVPLLRFYIERKLVDPAQRDGSLESYGERHLLQLVAVQILRTHDLDLERIGHLVHGVDDDNLRLLCDKPDEAATRAAVMENWLQMLNKGRSARGERHETMLANQAEPAVAALAPLQPPAPPAPRPAPPAPATRWTRAALLPGVEVHIREGALERADDEAVEQALVKLASLLRRR